MMNYFKIIKFDKIKMGHVLGRTGPNSRAGFKAGRSRVLGIT